MNVADQAALAATHDHDEQMRLQVSALVDGELDEATIERTIDALLASDDLARFWADAHRAGDWMRSEEVIGVGHGEVFLRKVAEQLANEPTILAPKGGSRSRHRRFWIRTGLPSASVAAALVVVAWVAMPLGRDDPARTVPTVAIVPVPGPTIAANAQADVKPVEWTQVDPERLTDYVTAHRDVTPRYRGGAGAVQASYSAPSNASSSPSP